MTNCTEFQTGYRSPAARAIQKVRDHLDAYCRHFRALSSLLSLCLGLVVLALSLVSAAARENPSGGPP